MKMTYAFVDFVVGPIKTDISIKISSREITMDTMVPACVTHHLHRHCKRIKSFRLYFRDQSQDLREKMFSSQQFNFESRKDGGRGSE